MLPGYPAGMAATSPPYPIPRGAIPWGHPARNSPAGEGWGEGGLGTTNRLVRRVELTGATPLPTLSRKGRGRNNQRLAMTLRLIQRYWGFARRRSLPENRCGVDTASGSIRGRPDAEHLARAFAAYLAEPDQLDNRKGPTSLQEPSATSPKP